MSYPLFKRSRATVTMQAFTIVVGIVEFDLVGNLAEILHVHMPEPAQFGIEAAIKRVIGMASVTGIFRRHQMVLKMYGGQKRLIINVQTLAIIMHNMA